MLEKWDDYAPRLTNILKNEYNQKSFKTEWSAEVEDVLILLKLFPSKQIGRNVIASDLTFKKSIEKMIEFLPVNEQLIAIANTYRYSYYSFLTDKCSTITYAERISADRCLWGLEERYKILLHSSRKYNFSGNSALCNCS